MSQRSDLHDKFYVRTPDLSVYGDSDQLLKLQKPHTADRELRVPRHAAPLKYRKDMIHPPSETEQHNLYVFEVPQRSSRMTSEEFYRGFSCTGTKTNAIIANFIECYLERKIHKEGLHMFSGKNLGMLKGKSLKSKRFRDKFRSLPPVDKPTEKKPTNIETLRQTLRWKQRFLASTAAHSR